MGPRKIWRGERGRSRGRSPGTLGWRRSGPTRWRRTTFRTLFLDKETPKWAQDPEKLQNCRGWSFRHWNLVCRGIAFDQLLAILQHHTHIARWSTAPSHPQESKQPKGLFYELHKWRTEEAYARIKGASHRLTYDRYRSFRQERDSSWWQSYPIWYARTWHGNPRQDPVLTASQSEICFDGHFTSTKWCEEVQWRPFNWWPIHLQVPSWWRSTHVSTHRSSQDNSMCGLRTYSTRLLPYLGTDP